MMVPSPHTEVWNACLTQIKKSVNRNSFKTWFEPIRPLRLVDSELTIQVPNKFFYDYLEQNFVNELRHSLRHVLGEQGSLLYKVSAVNSVHTPVRQTVGVGEAVSLPNHTAKAQIRNPFIIPGIKSQEINSNLNVEYTFDNFIEGDCNKMARAAGEAIANNPGGTAYNPLFVYGDTGMGKTHLGNAIGNAIKAKYPEKNVLLVSADAFTNQIVASIRNNTTTDTVNFYLQMDVLIVDDIHNLAKRKKTQDIFFHIFNQLHQSHRQVIMTSDKEVYELDYIEERLISRFKWGLSADLSMPDTETLMAIAQTILDKLGMERPVPNDILEYICFNTQDNIRDLEGALRSFSMFCKVRPDADMMDMARESVKRFVKTADKTITIPYIQETVAKYFDVTVEQLKSKTRVRKVVQARQLSMFLAKKLTDTSLQKIGGAFGNRDHSTVIYSLRAVQNFLDTDPLFKDAAQEVEKRITLSRG